ncbi:MAG: SDR family NAD(P)-dependent oxidoreductase [Phreatobacter sp.]|uniref:SDR family NAD(P)-dependent oxidoreductase n=1 Tax=Phreatobacter sp. TaxID=1966341 RepID=UPI001A40300F|nr:SDR family NAD(P)-dependent oxidoreductase [Phreatobacter sp.]MBL8568072.1 SDR family NAD(P)-dependent oxidoreductase [Phreatobacter sp.]
MPSVVVTGVSTGIGAAIAADLCRRGWRVFGTVRRMDDADRLASELGSNFTPVIADVTDVDSLSRAAATVAEALDGASLDGLVCNAGISIPGPILHQPLEELDRQWKVNVLGQVATVQAFGSLLGAREGFAGKPGRIVMMSSVSGRLSWPVVGGYAASKHALEAISHSLRRELIPFGVDVVIVGPGPIATPIWEKSAAGVDRSLYQATIYGPLIERFEKEVLARAKDALPPEAVADVVHTALTAETPKVRYAITPAPLMNWLLPLMLPARWLDRIAAKRLGLTRRG